MANPSLPLYCRLLLMAATVLFWQACYAQPGYSPNYQPVIELAPEEPEVAALQEQPVSEDPERNIFLSMLSRAQTANQLAALNFEPLKGSQRATMGDAEVSRLGTDTSPAAPDGDGLVALLVIAFLVWYFSFRR